MSLIHKNFRPRMVKMPVFSDDALQRLTMPVMAILGGKDVLLDSAATKRRLERNVAHAEIRYFPEAGHFIPAPDDADPGVSTPPRYHKGDVMSETTQLKKLTAHVKAAG